MLYGCITRYAHGLYFRTGPNNSQWVIYALLGKFYMLFILSYRPNNSQWAINALMVKR